MPLLFSGILDSTLFMLILFVVLSQNIYYLSQICYYKYSNGGRDYEEAEYHKSHKVSCRKE